MSYIKRLDRAFKDAPVLPINQQTKYVFISDCHRGVGDNKDNFLKNENAYIAALQHYYHYGYTYIEVGDGDELWENKCLDEIMSMHTDVFSMLSCFHKNKRLYMLYGNHDIEKRYNDKCFRLDFPDFKVYEGIILEGSMKPQSSDIYNHNRILVTHGHQSSLLNSTLWRVARFLVRYLWAPLEYYTFKDPTSAAKNNNVKDRTERRLSNYALKNNVLLIAGHTHRPTMSTDTLPYINCGSCVHPQGITCVELCGSLISLVRWMPSANSIKTGGHRHNSYAKCPPEYPVYITRQVLEQYRL